MNDLSPTLAFGLGVAVGAILVWLAAAVLLMLDKPSKEEDK